MNHLTDRFLDAGLTFGGCLLSNFLVDIPVGLVLFDLLKVVVGGTVPLLVKEIIVYAKRRLSENKQND